MEDYGVKVGVFAFLGLSTCFANAAYSLLQPEITFWLVMRLCSHHRFLGVYRVTRSSEYSRVTLRQRGHGRHLDTIWQDCVRT